MRFLLVCTLALAGLAARAQVRPLGGDQSRADDAAKAPAQALRTTALALPFFDDFTTPRNGLPRPDNWAGTGPGYPLGDGTTGSYRGGGAYVSNRLAVDPLTRGTATLDGLRANGLPYTPENAFATGATDTLTSQAIDLSGVNAGSNVYLSFAWQAGSLQGPPATSGGAAPVRLVLELLSSGGLWNPVWTYNSEGKVVRFRHKVYQLNQAGYFFNGFRFRFRALGSRNTSQDSFGLDYVYLNSNRTAGDTLFADVAFSRPLSNPLRRYTSLPTWQYAAASTSELSTSAGSTLNRLTATGILDLPVRWDGVVRELSAGGFGPAAWLGGSAPIAGGARQVPVLGNPSSAPLPPLTTPRTFRYQAVIASSELNPLTQPNDSISRDVTLADYYAFDDGTAEAAYGLRAQGAGLPSAFAYALDLNKNDAVKSIRIAPIFNNIPASGSGSGNGGDNFQNRTVTVGVWSNINGMPGTLLASKTGVLLNPLNPANLNTTIPVFQEIQFDQPVAVTGRCYVGYTQVANSQFPQYGYDLNNVPPANAAFTQTSGGAWVPFAETPAGAVMLRAVMTNGVLATQAAQTLSAQFSLYPNPGAAGTTVAVDGPAFRQAALLDALGRRVWQQPAAEAGRPALRLPAGLPAGLYLVQLTLADGSVATRRLTVE